jgi:tRNA nucleotidyltransferase (CCA-adding enzyme)
MQIIATHNNADFDALASIIAASILYPKAVPVLPKHLNPNVKAFFSIHKNVFNLKQVKEIDLELVDSLIVVDNNKWSRLGGLESLRKRDELEIILWDHHADDGDIEADIKNREEVGATVTLLVGELQKKMVKLSPVFSTLFLIGIYEDTGNLIFSSSRPADAYAVGYLLDQNADLHTLNTFLKPAYGEKQKVILFEMLQDAEKMNLNGFSVSLNMVNIKGHIDRLSLVVHMYREILNVDAAFGVFVHSNEKCMIIGRSSIDAVNIGSIMRSMGGGGHPGAGSAVLKSVKPSAVIEWIRELIQGNQQSSVQISDLMSFPVVTVREKTTMRELNVILDEKGCTGIPVLNDEHKLTGVISRRDFNKIRKQSQLDSPVKAYMSARVKTIEPGVSPMQAARLMVKHDIGRLPVVENDEVIGIITRSDAMTYFYDLLPE